MALLNRKVAISISVPKGATHYHGDIGFNPKFMKKLYSEADGGQLCWWYYSMQNHSWYFIAMAMAMV